MHVQTVLGPVLPEKIGLTDSHEHLFIRGGMPVQQSPDFLLNDYDKIARDARLFKEMGGSAIVEMSPIDWGRDAESLVRLAQETGLHIVAATGFHKTTYYCDIHWIHTYSTEALADLVCDELLVGMDRHNYNGPVLDRISARAGVIKVGTRSGEFDRTERKLLRVAARAHLASGAPIITHTDEGSLALEQIEFLSKEGVSTDRIALSHLDRRIDLGLHKEVASTGAFLEYDALTRVKQGFDKSTLKLILEMCEAGCQESILLGGDISRQGYWRSYGGKPGLDFLVGGFRNSLTRAGLAQETLDAMYIQNARKLLTWSPPEIQRAAASKMNQAPAHETYLRGHNASSRTVRSVIELVRSNAVRRADRAVLESVVDRFSLAIPPALGDAIASKGSDHPLARQYIPSAAELDVDPRELADPIGDEQHARGRAIIHRYPDRVLLKATQVCPVYCRFCFRREVVGAGAEAITKTDLEQALTYVRSHTEIWEVILSGGDPLILSDERLSALMGALHAIDHVAVVRIHTKFPIASPARITPALVDVLKGRATVYVVLHCNHPRELTQQALGACGRLIDSGVPMLAQSVLLRDVNDDVETMTTLMRRLVEARIKPYYLHHLDLARGTGHFRASVKKGQEILRQMRGHLSGLCHPTYVLDIPGGFGKTPIGPEYIRPSAEAGRYEVVDYQNVRHTYVDMASTAALPSSE